MYIKSLFDSQLGSARQCFKFCSRQDIKLAYTVLVNEDGEQITIPKL